MEDETIDAKLKHLGGSIDKVREDVREVKTDVKELRVEGQQRSQKISELSALCAADHVQIETNKTGIRDTKLLIWKILTVLAAGGYAADKILN